MLLREIIILLVLVKYVGISIGLKFVYQAILWSVSCKDIQEALLTCVLITQVAT